MTNCLQLVSAAYARRVANNPEKLATRKELIALIDRTIKVIYAKVNGANRRYFGTSAAVTGVAGVWARPADATAVLWVQNASNARVHIVPFEDREAEISPAIYPFEQTFKTVGGSGDPASTAVLTFFYAKRHPDLDPTKALDATENQLDASWPEHYNDMIIAMIARYLAIKAERTAEVGYLEEEYAENEQVLLAEAMLDNDRISQRWESE